jgi:hypothetical protein
LNVNLILRYKVLTNSSAITVSSFPASAISISLH